MRDDENRLVGHANMYEVDEYQYDFEERDADAAEGDDVAAALGLAAVAGIAVVAAHSISRYRESRALKRGCGTAITPPPPQDFVASQRVLPPAGWCEDPAGRVRWWDGQQWTEHLRSSEGKETGLRGDAPETRRLVPEQEDLSPSRRHGATTMSSAEWQERASAMLLARAFSDEQRRLLADAHIEDADPVLLQNQRELRDLSPQQFADRISAILETNAQLPRVATLPPAGWYDDGSGNYRWWDSVRWTGHVQLPVPTPKVLANPRSSPSPGWYDDGSGRQRWWNGQHWA